LKNIDSSVNDGSSAQSLSSVDEDPENTVPFWREKCRQLEAQLQEAQTSIVIPSADVEIQCSIMEAESASDSEGSVDQELLHRLTRENEQLKSELSLLKEEIHNLNFQLSSISMQRSTSSDVSE
jgi:predicted RNase H-like nuclease (RuvC/YqgF family)